MSETLVHHERALCGLVLLEPSTLDRCEIELGGYPWIDDICGKLFPLLVGMRRKGEPIADIRGVALLGKEVGVSAADIAKLATRDAGNFGNDAYHLSFLTEATERSKLRRIAAEIQRRLNDPMEPVDEIQEYVSKQLYANTPKALAAKNAGTIMLEVVAQSKERKPTISVQTGLRDLDGTIGGFRSGQLVVLAARPSIGKSALASQVAIHAAKENHNVLFVSLEMTSAETVSRVLAMETGLDMRAVLDGGLASHEIAKAEQIAKGYLSIPLMIEDRRGLNIDRLAMLIRSTSARKKLGLVVIDYLGLVAGDKRKPRWESITEISNQLKTLAQTESIPVLALCQLNRDSEGEVPKLSHLRDSGAIEQDADIVLLLHRETRNSKDTELFIAKNRNGPTGKIKLEYQPEKFEFRSSFADFTP